MRKVFFFILQITIASSLDAQKPPIDLKAIESWISVGNGKISNDGKYASYIKYSNEGFPVRKPINLVTKATFGKWKKEMPVMGSAFFTKDSQQIIFKNNGDSLCFLTLGTDKITYISRVQSFELFTLEKTEYLAYLSGTPELTLVIRDVKAGHERKFSNIKAYHISKASNSLILEREVEKYGKDRQLLYWVDLPGGMEKNIWRGVGSSYFVFDEAGKQVAFIVTEGVNNKMEQSFWYYRQGTEKARLLVDGHAKGIDKGFSLNGIDRFSSDGARLFFQLREPDFPSPEKDAVMVDIWSYLDAKLQSNQLAELDSKAGGGPRNYLSAVDISSRRILRLQRENETIFLPNGKNDQLAMIIARKEHAGQKSWNQEARASFYLVSTKDGSRRNLPLPPDASALGISPEGMYLILRNEDHWGGVDCSSYEIATGMIRDLTTNLPIPATDEQYNSVDNPRGLYLVAWLSNDKSLLISDRYDIWEVDPSGRRPAICISNGYGRKNNISFRLLNDAAYRTQTIEDNDRLVLSAFNNLTKENGFYSVTVGREIDPKKLSMGSYCYYFPYVGGQSPIKARDKEVYLVSREKTENSPNYFATRDFINFQPVSQVYSEKNYNWLQSELVNYKSLNGESLQGVLYRPENFDSAKKYPLIIHYYEKVSHKLNVYKFPQVGNNNINIPWFVSRGYLVFTPDIYYENGYPGLSAFNAVVGAAKYLSKLKYVDSSRMGLQGHSFGGFETNYIVAHTNRFAAAMSASGVSDLISNNNSITLDGRSKMNFHQYRMAKTLWERPDLYIENSPVLTAHKITTPLMLMNNKLDGAVNFEQGIEFFNALRRLGKRVWMLQYDGESHSILKKRAKADYTIRITQFFNHYLKGKPAPKWMTRGIPAKLKGVDDGLDLDYEVKTPPIGELLIPEERRRMEELQNRKSITITIE